MTVRGSLAARQIALAVGGDGRPDASGNYAVMAALVYRPCGWLWGHRI
jgi:hypothetical protein